MQNEDIAAFDGKHVTVTYTFGGGQLTATGFLNYHRPPAGISPATGLPGLPTVMVTPLELRPRRERNIACLAPEQITTIAPADLPELLSRCPKIVALRSWPKPDVRCSNRATVPIHWGAERTMVCASCANDLTHDDYLIGVCRLPNGHDIRPLTPTDRAEARDLVTRIAHGAIRIVETDRGMTAVIHHWGRQHSALEALRRRGFQALQTSDNPTVRIVARRQQTEAA